MAYDVAYLVPLRSIAHRLLHITANINAHSLPKKGRVTLHSAVFSLVCFLFFFTNNFFNLNNLTCFQCPVRNQILKKR